ncbi:hypothetical protein AAIA72_10080 [Hahella sp. SMD15-11]|uniref:Uncharacterized protein n=1 Tax=Thermohahella caldifontis TaxID=3142973 RepID=A0AB39US66_9GAMM
MGQQELTGQGDDGAFARQPGIDARIGQYQGVVAQIVGVGQIGKGVFITGSVGCDFTDEALTRLQVKGSSPGRVQAGNQHQTKDE